MIRLKDIAERAGVSVMTVSKVMRDASDISAATKVRVRTLADQMGYVPDTMAQSLRSRRTKIFGLVISTVTNPLFSRIVLALEEQSRELGYDVILAHTLNLPEREETAIRRLLARRVDGLFISPVYRLGTTAAPIYQEILRRKVPTIILGPKAPFCSTFYNVETEDVLAAAAATRHLAELGHKRIAFLAGPTASPWAQERFDGYRRGLRETQIEFDEKLVFQAGTTIEEGEKAALQLLNESPGVTAVQAVNDLVAIGASNVFLNQKIRIPQDLSIVGFGNVLVSEHFRVPLTTIRQPKYRLGLAAMDAMRMLLAGQAPSPRRLSAELVIRESSARPGSV